MKKISFLIILFLFSFSGQAQGISKMDFVDLVFKVRSLQDIKLILIAKYGDPHKSKYHTEVGMDDIYSFTYYWMDNENYPIILTVYDKSYVLEAVMVYPPELSNYISNKMINLKELDGDEGYYYKNHSELKYQNLISTSKAESDFGILRIKE